MNKLDDSQMEDGVTSEVPLSYSFVPPSIQHDTILSGESYEYYSQVPPTLLAGRSNAQEDSAIPQLQNEAASCRPCALGIDEAGRGPVLGPMVYGAFYLPIELSKPLLAETHHFDDSKVLTPLFRSQLMEKLCTPSAIEDVDLSSLHQNCGWAVSLLSARTISAGMLQPTASYNLNAQAMDATIALITKIYKLGVNVKEIYIDTIGQPAAYQKKLERIFPTASIVVAKKADSLYPCVSAASVCAKVTRDVALETIYEQNYPTATADESISNDVEMSNETAKLSNTEEPGWGSGYPSDVRCTTWMKRNLEPTFGWGTECRFSWGTAKDMLEIKGTAAQVTWPKSEDEESSRLTDFFRDDTTGAIEDEDELSTWYGRSVGVEAF